MYIHIYVDRKKVYVTRKKNEKKRKNVGTLPVSLRKKNNNKKKIMKNTSKCTRKICLEMKKKKYIYTKNKKKKNKRMNERIGES